jgi:hypothetical protein
VRLPAFCFLLPARDFRLQDFEVLSSVERVVSQTRSVYFHPDRVGPAILEWGHHLGACSFWDHPCHLFDGTDESARWIFTLDVLNHCFWPDPGEPVWTVTYNGELYSGYRGLAAGLKRAREQGFPVTDPHYLSGISAGDLAEILSGQGRIPMFEDRLKNLRQAGSIILAELGGDIMSLFHAASGSAVRLVRKVVRHFPSFRDEAPYRNGMVYFWKRAQIFASDIFAAFRGKGCGEFHDMERLTAFADYKLPQVLRQLGIISYDRGLASKIDAGEYLRAGSEEEVEIRAMTLWAAEQLKKAFPEGERRLTSPEIDSWLWQLGQLDFFRKHPYHRCRTIFY